MFGRGIPHVMPSTPTKHPSWGWGWGYYQHHFFTRLNYLNKQILRLILKNFNINKHPLLEMYNFIFKI